MRLEGSLARRGTGPWSLAAVAAALAACLASTAVPVSAQDAAPARFTDSAAVTRLPAGYVWAEDGSRRYAVHDGRFFAWVPQEKHFVPVAAPLGAALPAAPRGSRVTRVRGVTYRLYRGVYYKASRRKGRAVWVVAKV